MELNCCEYSFPCQAARPAGQGAGGFPHRDHRNRGYRSISNIQLSNRAFISFDTPDPSTHVDRVRLPNSRGGRRWRFSDLRQAFCNE
jgi:hypothetical protein